MKANQALIAWTPGYDVKITSIIEPDEKGTAPYIYTGGAAYTRTRALTGDASKLQLFIDFNTLVVREMIDPRLVHEAFKVVDEYRACVAEDVEGEPTGIVIPAYKSRPPVP